MACACKKGQTASVTRSVTKNTRHNYTSSGARRVIRRELR